MTQIGTRLDQDEKGKMTQFLRENSDVFAWLVAEMPGIPPSVIFHSLKYQSTGLTCQAEKEKARS